MGVMSIRKVEGPAELGLWEIREGLHELLQQVELSETEKHLFNTFRVEHRQLQWLAYRRLIREIISPVRYPVHYDEDGKPFLAGSNWHISVTHTDIYAGVIISRDVRVGIDMELVRPRIEKVKEKFLSGEELSEIPQDQWLEYLTLAWCAKEAVYKLYGLRNLDFRNNIRLRLPPGLQTSHFSCEVSLPAGINRYKLFQHRTGDLFIVWAIGSGQA